jgi:hypothetical protein
MRDAAGPADQRLGGAVWADRFRRFLRRQRQRGVPIDPQVDEELPDEIWLVEARFAVLAVRWIEEWHGDARAYIRDFHGGRPDPREGTFSWNLWCGGTPA